MTEDYDTLIAKVDAFCAEAERHAADALSCQRGCSACCHVWLTVSPVEARAIERHLAELPEASRADIARRGQAQGERMAAGETTARCPMLDETDSCSIYAARPLLCRTQGLALRYPPETVPDETVRFHASDGSEVVACPLNYTERNPRGAETLDADMLNTVLALVNHRHAEATGEDAGARVSLVELARQAQDF